MTIINAGEDAEKENPLCIASGIIKSQVPLIFQYKRKTQDFYLFHDLLPIVNILVKTCLESNFLWVKL